jgi:hypothetical protein
MDFDALYRSINELLEHVEDPSYAEKMRDYVKQVERQGIYSADDAIFDLYDEADKLDVGRFSGAEQVTPGLTPVRGGSSGPQKFTEQELDWLQNAGENYQKYSSMLSGNYYKYRNRPGGDRKAVTFLTEHPKIAVVDFMGALEGLKGNRGQFKQAMDTVANRFMPNNTSSADWQKHWKDALGPEKYGEIVLKAQEYMRGRARTDQFADMVGTEARNPRSGMNQKMQQMGIKTFEDVERAISEGRMTLNDIGSPELRKMYRENIRHRDEFYNTMYNTVNKTKGPAKMLNPYSDATGGIDYDALADEIVELEEQLDELIPTSPEWGKVNQELLKLIEKSQTLMP